MTAPPDAAALSRQLRTLWSAVLAGGALVLAVMGGLAVSGEPSVPELAQPAFFGVAVLSLGGLIAALALMRTLEDPGSGPGQAAEPHTPVQVQQRALLAIAALDATVVIAGVAALLTGDVLALAFGAPLFGFAAVFWPTEARVARWLGDR